MTQIKWVHLFNPIFRFYPINDGRLHRYIAETKTKVKIKIDRSDDEMWIPKTWIKKMYKNRPAFSGIY
jgi:hypothetical protein